MGLCHFEAVYRLVIVSFVREEESVGMLYEHSRWFIGTEYTDNKPG